MNIDFLLDILFPPACVCCAKRIRHGTLCAPCRSRLSSRGRPLRAVSDGTVSYIVGAAGSYENPIIQTLIHALKFRGIKAAAGPLAELLCLYSDGWPYVAPKLASFVVMPVPLSKQRERTRGFNQATLIARLFARANNLHVDDTSLTRVKHKKPQSETKNLAERKENIRGCFMADPKLCAQKNVILIDDVTTSGATFREAVTALKAAGVKKVVALAVAQA